MTHYKRNATLNAVIGFNESIAILHLAQYNTDRIVACIITFEKFKAFTVIVYLPWNENTTDHLNSLLKIRKDIQTSHDIMGDCTEKFVSQYSKQTDARYQS